MSSLNTSIPANDTPNSNLEPRLRTNAPESLERTGLAFQKFWVRYASGPENGGARQLFLDWWLTTDFGKSPDSPGAKLWTGKKTSESWKDFEQVAHEKTGNPKVFCARCSSMLTHPGYKRSGTASLKNHREKGGCRTDIRKQKKGIEQMIRDSVSSSSSSWD